MLCRLFSSLFFGCSLLVLFFVHVPPFGWLGVFIIVLVFVLRATPWLARGYDYCFVFCSRTALGWLGDIFIVSLSLPSVCVFLLVSPVWVCLMFCEVGFDSPTKLVSGDPLV